MPMLSGLDARTYVHADFYGLDSFPTETVACVCLRVPLTLLTGDSPDLNPMLS